MVIPNSIIEARSMLKSAFVNEAVSLGCNIEDANRLFEALPDRIKETRSEMYKLGDPPLLWRYVFGDGFHLGKKGYGFGIPHQMPLVSSLVRACLVANKHLKIAERNTFFRNLANPAKHYECLTEMLTVANVKSEDHIAYEKKGLGIGGSLIDWLVEAEEGKFLLEVKNRSGHIARNLEHESDFSQVIPYDIVPEIEGLFKSITHKFRPVSDSKYIQGAAIYPSLIVPKRLFENYFKKHIQEKLHFVALVREDGTHVNLVTSSDEIRLLVLSEFGWLDDADFLRSD